MNKQNERIFVRVLNLFEGQAEGRFAIMALVMLATICIVANIAVNLLM